MQLVIVVILECTLDRFVGDATRPLRGGVNLLQVKLGRIRRSLARLFFVSNRISPRLLPEGGRKSHLPNACSLKFDP